MDSQPRSLSDIDTARAMRTDDELRILVEAIHGSPAGTQEKNWLEWKNGLDLTKAAGKFAVAKAILGFANRSVEPGTGSTSPGISTSATGAGPSAGPAPDGSAGSPRTAGKVQLLAG